MRSMISLSMILCVTAGVLGNYAFSREGDYPVISDQDAIRVDLRYASTRNFMGENVYGDFKECKLHRIAARKLHHAAEMLTRRKPGWSLLVFDCLRPRAVQKKFWAKVAGTPKEPYVADPRKGSIHNFGFAVDLSLLNAEGKELDMGTEYDSFEPLAQPALEAQFLKKGKLTADQLENRRLLRDVMTQAGFIQLPLEWWHYDALPSAKVRKQYKIVE